jgi:hypothetical protein
MEGIDLIESWFCIWNDFANPNNGLNLVPNPLLYQNVKHKPSRPQNNHRKTDKT